MKTADTLLLTRSDVAGLLSIDECIAAVENAFSAHAHGNMPAPGVLGLHAADGGLHIKASLSAPPAKYFVAKANANFPGNPKRHRLPTIQGVIIVCDAVNGKLLAVMDSIEITIIRTGAATGVAAKYLALPNATTATIIGCGNQGRISIKALKAVRPIQKIFAFDTDAEQAARLCKEFEHELDAIPITASNMRAALSNSQVCVTCTTAKQPLLHAADIAPGTFIAAVGADNEDKNELHPDLFLTSKIVVDILDQCARIGDLQHALKQGYITLDGVHAALGQVIAQQKPGRESADEIIVFDSTGTALQDVAAAAIVYERATINGTGTYVRFGA
ncbi:MAG TPA: ornithine cyclodeaminase family protein [Chitinophagaceae bacterium]|nr:ornithine cyclodeaminase family protein [Chitinophagaceae bacterium]